MPNTGSCFGFNENVLRSFNSINPKDPRQAKLNSEAIKLAAVGATFSELPRYGIGLNIKLYEALNTGEIAGFEIGMGHLNMYGSVIIPWRKTDSEIKMEDLLKREPCDIMSHIVGHGFNYNAVRLMADKGYRSHDTARGQLKKRVAELSDDIAYKIPLTISDMAGLKKLPEKKNWKSPYTHPINFEKFLHTLNRYKTQNTKEYFLQQMTEIYFQKNGTDFIWNIRNFNFKQHKFISEDDSATLRTVYDLGGSLLCTCPTNYAKSGVKTCKHIEVIMKEKNRKISS